MRSVGRMASSRMMDILLHCVAVKEVRASGYATTGWILVFRVSQDSLVLSVLPRRSLSARDPASLMALQN